MAVFNWDRATYEREKRQAAQRAMMQRASEEARSGNVVVAYAVICAVLAFSIACWYVRGCL
jgi:hypothetical protein